jgi:hypothetical protein
MNELSVPELSLLLCLTCLALAILSVWVLHGLEDRRMQRRMMLKRSRSVSPGRG